jgi:hypothetical protein
VLLENDDAAALVETAPDGEPAPHHWRRDLLLLLGYVTASLVFWRSLLPHLATHTLGSGTLDPGLFIWFLNWTPYAITHGLSPFHTTYIDAPIGISAMWNTSVISLGVLFAPVTLAFGPIVTFNLACILGPPLSAWTASFWLRRYVDSLPAALGGLLFGFSPFVLAQSRAGHLMFTWLVLVPVILMLAEDILWRAARPIWPQAPLLGLVIALQLLISSETLLIVSMLCVGVAVALALRHPHAARRRLHVLLPAGAVTLGVAVVLCAWPLVEIFGGGREIAQPVQRLGAHGGSLAMLVGPSRALLLHAGRGPHAHLTMTENGMYIGLPLIAVLAVATMLLARARRRGVLIAAAIVTVAVALQLYGSHWHLGGIEVRSPLGFLQDRVALTRDILPGRFAIAMWIAIVWLFAVALDQAMKRAHGTWRAVSVVVAVACLIPLIPSNQEPTNAPDPIPTLFTTSLRETIPKGATVMIAPMATVGDNAAQLWQIKAKMRFRQVGGYALHTIEPNGSPSYYPYPKMLRRLFMINFFTGEPYARKVTSANLDTARRELRETHATLFMVGPSPTGTRRHLELAEQLLGRPPDRKLGGVAIWNLPAP